MSSSETSSKERAAEKIHVAGSHSPKRTKRLRVSLACAEVSRYFLVSNRRQKIAGASIVFKSDIKIHLQCRKKKELCDGNQPVC